MKPNASPLPSCPPPGPQSGLAAPIRICSSDELDEAGKGVRFPLYGPHGEGTGFVVRYKGVVHGYLNQCAHIPLELDWVPGKFFDGSGLYLLCSVHGAIYEPENGHCAAGPCRGRSLRRLDVVERQGAVWWQPDDVVQAPRSSAAAADGAVNIVSIHPNQE